MIPLRVLLVDDESAARRGMALLLAERPDFAVVGECDDGQTMVEAVRRLRPDIVFLDIRMPGLDGFEALGMLEVDPAPQVVFVTAYDRYAVRAFEAHAVDYLLKPYAADRFREACDRVRERCLAREDDNTRTIERLLRELSRHAASRERLVLRSTGKVKLIDMSNVDWMSGAGDYVRLHTGEQSHLVRETLRDLADRLDDEFVRVHRSTIVRLSAVKQLIRLPNGRWEIELPDGSRRPVSRSGRRRLGAALDMSL